MCMQFILENNPSTIFLFNTRLLLQVGKLQIQLVHGARQSSTDSAQLVDQFRTLYESKPLAFKALYASG